MPANIQIVSLKLQLGIDTKDSPSLVDDSKFLSITNGVFDKGSLGTLHLRNGYTALPGGPGTESIALFNQELLKTTSDGNLYSFHTTSSPPWEYKGFLPSAELAPRSVQVSGSDSYFAPDSATLGGVTVYAWTDALGSIFTCVVDEVSGSTIFSQTLYTSASKLTAAAGPRVLTNPNNGNFIVVYTDSAGSMQFWTMNYTSLIAFAHSGTKTGFDAGFPFDAVVIGALLIVVGSYGGDIDAFSLDPAAFTTVAGPHVMLPAQTLFQICICQAWPDPPYDTFFVAFSSTGTSPVTNEVTYIVLTTSGFFQQTRGLLAEDESFGTRALTAALVPGTVQVFVLRERDPVPGEVYDGVTPILTSTPTFGKAPPVSNIDAFLVDIATAYAYMDVAIGSLASQVWISSGPDFNFLLTNPSPTQQSFFLMSGGVGNDTTQVVGEIRNSGPAPTALSKNGRLAKYDPLATGNAIAISQAGVIFDSAGKPLPQTGIGELVILPGSPQVGIQLGGTLTFATGALLYGYDGNYPVEQGFPLYPEPPAGYLATSFMQVVIDQGVDLNGYDRNVFRIIVPDNPTTPGGSIGQFIKNNETITFNGFFYALWFTFTGSLEPTWLQGVNYVRQINVSLDDTAQSLAAKIYSAFRDNTGFGYVDVNSAYAIAPTPISYSSGETAYTAWGVQVMMPKENIPFGGGPRAELSALTVEQTSRGTTAGSSQIFDIGCCPANLIQPGQYFTFWVSNPTLATATANGEPVFVAVWFSINGVGDPPPFPETLVEVALTVSPSSWKTAEDVALRVSAALTAALPPGVASGIYYGVDVTGAGPILVVSSHFSGLATPALSQLSSDGEQDAQNPQLTGVGTSGLGAPIGQNIGTNVTTALSYAYVQTFEWTDNQNQINRSALSTPLTVIVPVFTQDLNSVLITGAVQTGSQTVLTTPPQQVFKTGDIYSINFNQTDNEQITVTTGGIGQFTATFANAHPAGALILPVTVPAGSSVQYAWNLTTPGNIIPANAAVIIQPSVLPWTMKIGVISSIYRTQANGETGYEVTPVVIGGAQRVIDAENPTGFIDLVSDSDLSGLTPLYTDSGAVENDGPPACSLLMNHQDRLWLAGLPDDPNMVWYSTPYSRNVAINFSLEQRIQINPSLGGIIGGPITAMASQDGNAIFFEENLIWQVTGTGPDATGANGEFSIPTIITSPVGCRDPGSICTYQGGTIFKSNQGFYLLDRSQNVTYIGAAVAAFNADVVTAANINPQQQRITFLSETGTTLVYDYLYNQWGTYDAAHQGTSALIWQGLYTYVNSSGLIYQENIGNYFDNTQGFPLIAQTAWIKFTGNVQGYNNIQRFILKGFFPGAQAHQIQIAYDYDPTIVDTFVFNDGVLTGGWGSDPNWGAAVWGGNVGVSGADVFQIQIWPSRTLCESIQITYTALQPFPLNKTPALEAIDFEVGTRRGAYKGLGAGNSLG